MKLFLPILLCCFVLTAGSFRSQAQDYTITTTGNEIIITDISGNGETLAVSESGSNIRFVVTPNTRTYSINGGGITVFTTPAEVALAGANTIIINSAGGNDIINMGTFTANLPSLTINGGTGDDAVNFNGDINFAANANLDVDLQNDDATPGVDRVIVAANANLLLSGTGAATVKASRSVVVNAGGSIETVNGNLIVEANQQTTATTGAFTGVTITGAGSKLNCSGSGIVTVNGRGGNSGTCRGVLVVTGGTISGGTAAVSVTGSGGSSTSHVNNGVLVTGADSRITSAGGNVSVTGTGGGSGSSSDNYGISVQSAGQITAGVSGTVTVEGNGGTVSSDRNWGVLVTGTDSRITSTGGNVSVTGSGGGSGTGNQNYGIYVFSAGQITAGSSGTVTVVGNGGTGSTGINNFGVYVIGTDSHITSSGGNVSVNGREGSGSGSVGIFTSSFGTIATAINDGNISLIANSMRIEAVISTQSDNSVTVRPNTNGVQIDLGSTSNTIGGPLGLSDTELDLITTGMLIIGDANSGAITISQAISRPAATNVQLRSSGDITFNQNFNTSGGTLLLAPGNAPAAVKPTFTGTDVSASTVSFASDLSIAINGTTPGDGTGSTYTRLTVAGSVDLTGVDLIFSGAYVPVLGNTFTIVDNDGADAIISTFIGLPEGATIPNFRGSGLNAAITYLGGDGNDVVLTVVESCIPITTIGAISGPVGVCRSATGQVFSVAPVPGATSYQWILPTGATGSSTTNSITLNFSSTYNMGMIAVKAINACSQSALSARQIQAFTSKPGTPKNITGKNLGTCVGNEIYSIPAVANATGYNWVAPANTTIVNGQGTTSIELSFAPGFVSGILAVTASNCMGTSTARTLQLLTKPGTPAAIVGPASVCPGAVGIKFSTTGLAGVTYNWQVPSGATITNGQGTAAITVNWGTAAGNVRVSAGNVCGVSAFRSLAVGLASCITIEMAEELQAEPAENKLDINLWPNPARDVLMITLNEFEPGKKMELTLMQADGKVQQAQSLMPTVKGQQVQMNVSRAAAGLYLLQVKQGHLTETNRLLIVR